MRGRQGAPTHRRRALWWIASAVTIGSALFLVTGLLVPGFMLDEGESSPAPDEAGPGRSSEEPWAERQPSLRDLTPDEAVRRLVTTFVDRLNTGRAADAVEMVCPDKRRLIRGSVQWTATHQAQLSVTTPLTDVARPGYATVRFGGAIQGRQRRGTIGLDADAHGRPSCVSAFFSVG